MTKGPDKPLIIIDELEASLHPTAQRGLMCELMRFALEKTLQGIVSTHSPFILKQLPSVARVFISVDRTGSRTVLHCVSSDFALNLMDDERHDELDIYCEDDVAVFGSSEFSLLGRLRLSPASGSLPSAQRPPYKPFRTLRHAASSLGRLVRDGRRRGIGKNIPAVTWFSSPGEGGYGGPD